MTTSKHKLLVIDDEVDLLNVLKLNLELCGYEVDTATSGNEGFEMYQKNKYDVIISDVRMPNGNGIELLTKIKKLSPLTPAICFITAYEDMTPAEIYNLGVEALFSKPFDMDELEQKIAQVCFGIEERFKVKPAKDASKIITEHFKQNTKEQGYVLGHGGFSIKLQNAPTFQQNEYIYYDISSDCNTPNIKGSGYLKWKEPTKKGKYIGIEFSFLDPSALKQTIAYILEKKIIPFIPYKRKK